MDQLLQCKMDGLAFESGEVGEAEIYVDFAEADGDMPNTPVFRPSPSLLQSRLVLPLESGEQAIRLPVSAGYGVTVKNNPSAARSIFGPASQLPSRTANGDQVGTGSLQPSGRPFPSGSYTLMLPESRSPSSLLLQPTAPDTSALRPPPKSIPPGVFVPSDTPPLHSGSADRKDKNADHNEDVDIDTPYDGRLLIQSASRPNELVSMLPKALSVARKSTTKGSSKKAAPGRARTAATARKSTGGLNKMIPKVMQIAKKSTTQQKGRSKSTGYPRSGAQTNESTKLTSGGHLLVKIGPGAQHGSMDQESVKAPQQRILFGVTDMFPDANEVLTTALPSGSQGVTKPKSLIKQSKQCAPEPNECHSAPQSLAECKPLSKASAPMASDAFTIRSKPHARAAASSQAVYSASDSSEKMIEWVSSTQNKTSPWSSPAPDTVPSLPDYRSSQKTAHRKGAPGQSKPPAKVMHKRAKITQRKRTLSGVGSESSTSESSETPAKVPKLHEAETELSATMALLNEKRELLRSMEEQLASVTTSLQTMLKNKVKLEAEQKKVAVCLVSLETAAQPFDCQTCTDAFQLALSCPREFRQIVQHKPLTCKHFFQCEQCTASFDNQKLLTAHLGLHKREQNRNTKMPASGTGDADEGPVLRETRSATKEARLGSTLNRSHLEDVSVEIVPSDKKHKQRSGSTPAAQSKSCDPTLSSSGTPQATRAIIRSTSVSKARSLSDLSGKPSIESKLGPKTQDSQESSSVPKKTRATCHVCGKKFEYYSQLTKHLKMHTSFYTCGHCNRSFSEKSAIVDHNKNYHKDKNLKVVCKYCRKQFPLPAALEKHIVVHIGGEQRTCSVCGKQFNWERNLNTHMQDTHQEEGIVGTVKSLLTGDFQCVKCGKSFMQPTSLVQHDETFHPDGQVVTNSQHNRADADIKVGDVSSKQGSKKQTGISSGMNKVGNHKNANTTYSKASLSRQKVASQLSAHIDHSGHAKGNFVCKVCGLSFTQKTYMRKHVRKCHPEAYFGECTGATHSCPVCERAFVLYPRMISHVREQHPGHLSALKVSKSSKEGKNETSKTSCAKCGISFQSEQVVFDHLQLEHPPKVKNGSFKCALCPKRYPYKINALRHMRLIHVTSTSISSKKSHVEHDLMKKTSTAPKLSSGLSHVIKVAKKKTERNTGPERGSRCQICQKYYKNINRHMRRFHPEVPVYQCSKCGEGFSWAKDYSEHQCQPDSKEDCRYRCHTCGRGFHIAWEWTQHMQEHAEQNAGNAGGVGTSDAQGTIIVSPTSILVKQEHQFRCVDCGDTFDDENTWAQHTCCNETSGISQRDDDISLDSNRLLETSLDMPDQGIKLNAGPVQCPVCNRNLAAISLRRHLHGIHRIKMRQCQTCQLAFTTVFGYQKHWSEHEGNYLPPTLNNDKSTRKDADGSTGSAGETNSPQLEIHVVGQAVCSETNPLVLKIKPEPDTLPVPEDPASVECSVCFKSFSPLYIRKHMRQVHSIFECKRCGEGFLDQLYFNRHMLQHREEELQAGFLLSATTSDGADEELADQKLASDTDMMKSAYSGATEPADSAEDLDDMIFVVTENMTDSDEDGNCNETGDSTNATLPAESDRVGCEGDGTETDYESAAAVSKGEMDKTARIPSDSSVSPVPAPADQIRSVAGQEDLEAAEGGNVQPEAQTDTSYDTEMPCSPNKVLSEPEGFKNETERAGPSPGEDILNAQADESVAKIATTTMSNSNIPQNAADIVEQTAASPVGEPLDRDIGEQGVESTDTLDEVAALPNELHDDEDFYQQNIQDTEVASTNEVRTDEDFVEQQVTQSDSEIPKSIAAAAADELDSDHEEQETEDIETSEKIALSPAGKPPDQCLDGGLREDRNVSGEMPCSPVADPSAEDSVNDTYLVDDTTVEKMSDDEPVPTSEEEHVVKLSGSDDENNVSGEPDALFSPSELIEQMASSPAETDELEAPVQKTE